MRLPRWLQQLRLRPRLLLALGLGLLAGLACPTHWSLGTRLLCGWNAGVWSYLLAVLQMMLAADHEHVQRKSVAQADGVARHVAVDSSGLKLAPTDEELADLQVGQVVQLQEVLYIT